MTISLSPNPEMTITNPKSILLTSCFCKTLGCTMIDWPGFWKSTALLPISNVTSDLLRNIPKGILHHFEWIEKSQVDVRLLIIISSWGETSKFNLSDLQKQEGIPQGSILSVSLFSIFFFKSNNNILKLGTSMISLKKSI